ncbi:hypothetical protein CEXT_585251 [Caerostris extrusa]|uniref:Uncharacterized protein n=1 Tax=Caerostris extrusa TaxID=172846 RepID=A0AAV4QLX9_CAEEX|nr:hypothetical protein CEXT_585251 [Caerostris extrusa]
MYFRCAPSNSKDPLFLTVFQYLIRNASFEKDSFKLSQSLPHYASGAKRNNHFEEKTAREVSVAETRNGSHLAAGGTNSVSHSSISEGRKCEENENRFPSQQVDDSFLFWSTRFSTGWVSPIRNGRTQVFCLGFFSFRWFSSGEFEICYQEFVEKEEKNIQQQLIN